MQFARRLAPRERNGLLLLLAVFCAFGVFDHSLWAPNDVREGAMIWDMYQSGKWTHLSLNGAPFLEKPPLLHWTALVLCRLFGGIHAGLLRLPAALYGFGSLWIVYLWGRALGRERGGILGAFLCATTLLWAEYSRIVLTDVCLAFMVTLSLHSFWRAHSAETGKPLGYAAFLLVTTFSFYAKGVLGPGLVMTSVVAFLVLRREWKPALILSVLFAPLLVVVVWPWAAALYREGGRDFLVSVFVDNQLGRFLALPPGAAVTSLPIVGPFLGFMADRPIPQDPYFVHKEPLYFYLVKLPIFWLPWTLLVPSAIGYWFKSGDRLTDPLCSLLRCAAVTIVVVLQVSSAKVACYALPLYPILFLMVGVWCDDVLSAPVFGFAAWMADTTSIAVRAILLALPSAYLILLALPKEACTRLATWFSGSARAPTGDPLIWIFAPDGQGAVHGAILCLIALGLALFTARWVRVSIRMEDRAGGLLKLVAATTAVLMLTLSAVMPAYDRQRTYEPIAALVRREIAGGRRVALAVGQEKDVAEFNYCAQSRFVEVSLVPGVRAFLEQDAQPRAVVVPVKDLDLLRESLVGLDHEVRGLPEGSGSRSMAFRLVFRN